MRDPIEAVQVARRAVDIEPRDRNYWNSLGVALYRAERWSEAVDALEKSMQLRSGGDRYDWIFLAMSYWQLGDPTKAQRWYEQAISQGGSIDPLFARIRTEAAQLIDERPSR